MTRRLALPSGVKVRGVSRVGDEPRALMVSFDRTPSDDDIRLLHTALQHPEPRPTELKPDDGWWFS
jgi:hypothetical protein